MTWVWNSILLFIAAGPVDLSPVREHIARGRFAEAVEWFDAVPLQQRGQPELVLEEVRLLRQTGRGREAVEVLEKAIQSHPGNADLLAEKACLLFDLGRITEPLELAEAALAINPNQVAARLVQADVWAATGKLTEASDGYRWFVRFYNQAQPTVARTLVVLGRGAAQYARWKGSAQIFDFLVNTLCDDALKDDPDCWEAHALAGELLLEKYNRADGIPELQAGLAVNPRAAEIHLVLASEALDQMRYDEAMKHLDLVDSTCPGHPGALRLKAKAHLSQGHVEKARSLLESALAARPHDQLTMALRAYLVATTSTPMTPARLEGILTSVHRPHASLERLPEEAPEFETIVASLTKVNPKPGLFLLELGRLFQGQRNLKLAELCFEAAIETMPQLSQPKSELAMLQFQAGRMEESRRLLDAAFQADPYHVRISNMRKVLRVLDGYATVTTPHFVLRADSELDGLLAKYMAKELEKVYADVTQEYGFEPAQRTQIEIYNSAKGLSGHQWFSARMIGLPWLQTIGASTGLIIALTSPTSTQEPYNWARVIRHEFVHVVTLQQTDFNIPQWFTEALATRAEGYPHPDEWDALLIRRFREKKLKNLDDIHLGFQRAESPDDWSFAYCQSVLYAEFFMKEYGDEALPKLLDAYRQTRSTEEALRMAFQADKKDVEGKYLAFLEGRVKEISARRPDLAFNIDAAEARFQADPQSAEAQADLALARLRQEKWKEARSLAEPVIAKNPHQPVAAYVLAMTLIEEDEADQAWLVLKKAWKPDVFDRRLWLLLGKMQLKAGRGDDALPLFREACRRDSQDSEWWQGLAQAAEQAGDRATLIRGLERLCQLDGNSAAARLKRAEIALEEKQYDVATAYAERAMQIDLLDVNAHRLMALGLAGQGQYAAALEEFDVALQLKPGDDRLESERANVAKQQERSP